jgi:hypothetical protein
MLQQVTIKTEDKATLKRVLESAIQNEKKILMLGLERTRQRISTFEKKYAMTSVEFEQQLQNNRLLETVEFTDWRMELGMLRLLERQYQTLEDAELD